MTQTPHLFTHWKSELKIEVICKIEQNLAGWRPIDYSKNFQCLYLSTVVASSQKAPENSWFVWKARGCHWVFIAWAQNSKLCCSFKEAVVFN